MLEEERTGQRIRVQDRGNQGPGTVLGTLPDRQNCPLQRRSRPEEAPRETCRDASKQEGTAKKYNRQKTKGSPRERGDISNKILFLTQN